MADKYTENLHLHLEMNHSTWHQLLEHGVTENTELALNYLYYVPNEDNAVKLKRMLHEYGYYVDVKPSGWFFNKKWVVEGCTNITTFSLGKLNQWVRWMVHAGQECEANFDGWGARYI